MSAPTTADPRPRRILPPAYFLLALVTMAALHFLFPGVQLIRPPAAFAGVPIIVLGISLAVVAAGLFARLRTPIHPFHQPTALATNGPYRFTRNPMYLSMVLILSGVGVVLGSLTPFLAIPSFVGLMQRRFIRQEEERLAAAFGQQYADYRRRVRRWI